LRFFLEYAEDTRFLLRVMTLIVCVESAVIMILGFMAVRQRIVYINPSQVIGTAYVGHVPDEAAGYFALSFLSFFGNVNKYSALEQYKSAYLLMSPQLQSLMKTTLEKEIDEITRSDISIQITPTAPPKITGDGASFTIVVDAVRRSFVYGQEAKNETLRYTIKCQKARTRRSNPFGLEVTSYDSQVVSTGVVSASAGNKQ